MSRSEKIQVFHFSKNHSEDIFSYDQGRGLFLQFYYEFCIFNYIRIDIDSSHSGKFPDCLSCFQVYSLPQRGVRLKGWIVHDYTVTHL